MLHDQTALELFSLVGSPPFGRIFSNSCVMPKSSDSVSERRLSFILCFSYLGSGSRHRTLLPPSPVGADSLVRQHVYDNDDDDEDDRYDHYEYDDV